MESDEFRGNTFDSILQREREREKGRDGERGPTERQRDRKRARERETNIEKMGATNLKGKWEIRDKEKQRSCQKERERQIISIQNIPYQSI